MSTSAASGSDRWSVRTVHTLSTVVIVMTAIAIGAALLGVNGAQILDRPDGDQAAITVRADLLDPVDVDDRLPPTMVDDDGTVTTSGLPRVDLDGTTTVDVALFEPTPSQRVLWLIPNVLGPLLVATGAWLLRSMARSARSGDPFTSENESRLWRLAILVAVGGTALSVLDGFTSMVIVQRSAAADLFQIGADVSFLPIVLGVVIAALASVWHVGVGLREDIDGTI